MLASWSSLSAKSLDYAECLRIPMIDDLINPTTQATTNCLLFFPLLDSHSIPHPNLTNFKTRHFGANISGTWLSSRNRYLHRYTSSIIDIDMMTSCSRPFS